MAWSGPLFRLVFAPVIEQLMIFALGFLFAGLLTLLFLPAFWRRAMRLSTRRLEMQMPLSMAEIVAERDQLRAEFAASTRRVEQKNERLIAASAVDRSELGRQAAAMVEIDAKLLTSRKDMNDLRAELAATERQVSETRGELAAVQKELFDSTGLAERRGEALAEIGRQHEELRQLADEKRAAVSGLETRAAGLELDLEDMQRVLRSTQLQLSDKIAAGEMLEREREFARSDATAAHAKRELQQASLEEANRRIEAFEKEARAGQRARSRMATQLAEQQRLAEAAREQETALRASIDKHTIILKDAERSASERLQDMRAQRDALQGAIDMLRKDNQALRQELSELRRGAPKPVAANGAGVASPSDDALLRQTIADIGTEVTRIAGALEAQADKATIGESVAERIRALQTTAGRVS
jgi:chromosome segregation ATPase